MVQETFLAVPIKSLFLGGKMPPCKPTLLASLSIKPRFQDSYPGTSHDQLFFMSSPWQASVIHHCLALVIRTAMKQV
jgi:hypothetical protein